MKSGGRAPEYLRYDQHLLALTRHFFDAGKPVARLCHGVEIPAAAGCLVGRKGATAPKCAPDITQFGRSNSYLPTLMRARAGR